MVCDHHPILFVCFVFLWDHAIIRKPRNSIFIGRNCKEMAMRDKASKSRFWKWQFDPFWCSENRSWVIMDQSEMIWYLQVQLEACPEFRSQIVVPQSHFSAISTYKNGISKVFRIFWNMAWIQRKTKHTKSIGWWSYTIPYRWEATKLAVSARLLLESVQKVQIALRTVEEWLWNDDLINRSDFAEKLSVLAVLLMCCHKETI